jgi:type I restriction enzyme S subunit
MPQLVAFTIQRQRRSAVQSEAAESAGTKNWLYHPVFPEHWTRRALYSLAQWVNGLAFRDIQFSPYGKPIIKIAEIKRGISGQTKFTEQTFDESVHVRAGDLLFSWSGQPETSIDVFWWRGSDGWLNQHSFRVMPIADVELAFFYYLLKYLKPNFIGIARNKQTTGLGHVTKRDLENIEVAFPPLSKQRAIADILGSLDDKIELNRRMNGTLEAMARAIFKSWFVNSVSSGIPQGWKAGAFSDDFELIMGQSPPGNTYNEEGKGLPFFQGCADFGPRYPTNRIFCTAPTRLACPGDTLVSVRAPVGDINMAAVKCSIGRGVAAVRHKTGSRSYTFYRMQTLEEVFGRFEAEGTVFGSIRKNDFQQIRLIIPPTNLIQKFEHTVYPIDQAIENNEKCARTLAAIRDALLPKLISGELRA